jgi:hypothetical protein
VPVVRVGLNNLGNALREHFRRRQRDLVGTALEVCTWGVAEGVRIADAEDIVDQGLYKAGFRAAPVPNGAVLVNDAAHAQVIEIGRRPRRPGPPIGPIREWVRRKLGLTGAELERRAFAIRRAIHRHGTPPKYVMFRVHQRMRPRFRAEAERRLGR